MRHVMFDVDGTLVDSDGFDGDCYLDSVYEVLGHRLDPDWTRYTHVSDAGILDQHIRENRLDARADEIRAEVKAVFTSKISGHIEANPARQIPGAARFIDHLRRREDLSISIATGGWRETALIKLESAQIDVSGIPIASSNNHYSRTEIMKIAATEAVGSDSVPCTYFGDGEWDRRACEQLGYNFVLVGNGTSHDQAIADFDDAEQALRYIGL